MSAREPAILGIDLGTNEVKSGLVTLDGQLLASARAGYATDLGRQPGWAEQDPGAWWAAVTETIRVLAALDVADIVAVCADGHGPTLVAVDATGQPTRPADRRGPTRGPRSVPQARPPPNPSASRAT